eukprot:2478787-Pyramimonas_sp.AAC.1
MSAFFSVGPNQCVLVCYVWCNMRCNPTRKRCLGHTMMNNSCAPRAMATSDTQLWQADLHNFNTFELH